MALPSIQEKTSNAALQRPGDNCIRGKLSMRDMLIPVRCKRLFGGAHDEIIHALTEERAHQLREYHEASIPNLR